MQPEKGERALRTAFFVNGGVGIKNSDSWGANGLGCRLTPQLLWSLEATDQVDELIEDFLQNCFGPAKEPMREFYDLLNRDATVRSNEDVVARMYRRIDEARRLTDDEEIHLRLDDLILYTRYLELYYAYRAAEGDERQQAFERIWRYAYRMRDRMIISTQAICLHDRFRDNSVAVPDSLIWNKGPVGEPFGQEEIASILAEGILANEPTTLDFELVEYSDDLALETWAEAGLTDTETFMPSQRSPARDAAAGRVDYMTTDHYNNIRYAGDAADLGAVERQSCD